jgi:type IV pilus assembly protein PilV
MGSLNMTSNTRKQGGMFLIEALIAILIFALGILGMIAMGGTAVSAQSDAQYRTEASNLADAIAGQIAIGVDRSSEAALALSLQGYKHQEAGTDCTYAGPPITGVSPGPATVLALLNKAGPAATGGAGLPGVTGAMQQIRVDTAQPNRVEITLCWKTVSDNAARRHTLVTYVN